MGRPMNFKLLIYSLITMFLFSFGHSFAQDWHRNQRNQDISYHWRKSHKISKYPESIYGWHKDRAYKRTRTWKHKSKHLRKKRRIYNPSYWRYSGVGYPWCRPITVERQIIVVVPLENPFCMR